MNDDTISRQAAIDTALRAIGDLQGKDSIRDEYIVSEMEEIPSAERHGHWEFIGGYGYQYRCSVCVTCAERKTKFCPNCGAKMDEVKK